jgi:UTP--glucose-1-phosphate uridylyltransferase
MSIDLAVVPVAGQGTRLLPSTKSQPKEMLPVGRKPVVQYVVEELAGSGIRRMLFVTGPGKASIENHFDVNPELIAYLRETGREELLEELEFERTVPEYYYTRQRRQLGLGHAVLCAESLVGNQPFVVALGDTILGLERRSDVVRRMAHEFTHLEADAVIALALVSPDEVDQYGIAKPKQLSADAAPVILEDLVEKPRVAEAPSRLSVAARYVFSPKVFDALRRLDPGPNGEIELTDAIRSLIRDGGNVYGMCLAPDERRFDVGNFDSYFRAFVEFAMADPRYGDALRDYLVSLMPRLG